MHSGFNTVEINIHQYLKELIHKRQEVTSINLEFQSINDLLQYLHHFQKLPSIEKLSLHGNYIKQLPADLSDVFPNLEDLDLTNNPLTDNIQMLLMSLKSLPKLKNLRCAMRKQHEFLVGSQIKSLQFINNIRVRRQKAKVEFQFKNANEKTLHEFQESILSHYKSLLFYEQKYLGSHVELDAMNRFQEQISQISRECLQKLSINKNKATANIQYVFLFMAKFHIYDCLKSRCLQLCRDIHDDLGKFMSTVFDQQSQIFTEISELTVTLSRLQIELKQKQMKEVFDNKFQQEHSIINKNAILQNQLKRIMKEKDQLVSQINRIQTHNKKLTDLLHRFAQGNVINKRQALNSLQTFQTNKGKQNMKQPTFDTYKQKSVNKVSEFKQLSTLVQQGTPMRKKSMSKSPHKISIFKENQHNASIANRSNTYHNNSYSANSRSLTLKQLKQTINEIYQSKLRYDEKNYNSKMPRQTMNGYFFIYLNQKYGLRSLTIEAADNIISAIQSYLNTDIDIQVFYKIFKNQIDEEFRFVQEEIKTTLSNLLRKHIQVRMPYKAVAQTKQILQKKINGDISFEQCQDLVKYLYNPTDAKELCSTIQLLFKQKSSKQVYQQSSKKKSHSQSFNFQTYPNNPNIKVKIQYSTFLKEILSFQLQNHQKLLKPLVQIFRDKDKDGDGIINEGQFIEIINILSGKQANLIPTLLQIIDPYDNRTFTFTQMVKLVANYPEHSPLLNRFIEKEDKYFNAQF